MITTLNTSNRACNTCTSLIKEGEFMLVAGNILCKGCVSDAIQYIGACNCYMWPTFSGTLTGIVQSRTGNRSCVFCSHTLLTGVYHIQIQNLAADLSVSICVTCAKEALEEMELVGISQHNLDALLLKARYGKGCL